MLRILVLSFTLLSAPAMASLVNYDYTFEYDDISQCDTRCNPESKPGNGHLTVDKSDNSLRHLWLETDSFSLRWEGHATLDAYEDGWTTTGGKFYSAQSYVDHSSYSVSLFLDLFFVPDDSHPLDYFENAVEHHNTVDNGVSRWALYGSFQKLVDASVPEPAASVPEPSSLLLMVTVMLAMAGRRWRPTLQN